jgi:hypothetical protein
MSNHQKEVLLKKKVMNIQNEIRSAESDIKHGNAYQKDDGLNILRIKRRQLMDIENRLLELELGQQ